MQHAPSKYLHIIPTSNKKFQFVYSVGGKKKWPFLILNCYFANVQHFAMPAIGVELFRNLQKRVFCNAYNPVIFQLWWYHTLFHLQGLVGKKIQSILRVLWVVSLSFVILFAYVLPMARKDKSRFIRVYWIRVVESIVISILFKLWVSFKQEMNDKEVILNVLFYPTLSLPKLSCRYW